MGKKVHYKLHKVKKQWVTIAVTSAALASIVGGATVANQKVSADETTKPVASTTAESDVVVETHEVAAPEATATTDATAVTTDKAADTTTVETPAAVTTAADTTTNTAAPAATDRAAVANGATTETPAATWTATDTTLTVAEKPKSGVTEKEETAALSLDNIKQVDGKYYYVKEDGSYKTNFAVSVNGQLLYFGKDGALTSTSTHSFTPGTTNLVDAFSSHNRAYDSKKESFELVDGYLTPNSWYRPVTILENGEKWRVSTEKDFRPLLMAWWPDVDTQVAYLNTFSKHFNLNATYSTSQSQSELNAAAKTIQIKIEQEISAKKSTEWLRQAIESFVKEQDQWNTTTENYTLADHLQGGALLYVNNDKTPWANSDYRLLNRTPSNQDGSLNGTGRYLGGYEFLLANDVDNSNPVVQAEQLNQIHYLVNWGSIVMGDKDANFDGIRVDAVDNVDADLLQVYTNYFRAAFGVDKSEANALAHISILEAWDLNDNAYNQKHDGAALAMDNNLRYAIMGALYGSGSSLKDLITSSLTDRTNNSKYGDTQANYIFARAHDNLVQDIIRDIVQKEINQKSDGYTMTDAELKRAFEIYNEDMKKAEKRYTINNIPAAYALILQNMEQVTRVYYGDLYTDNGQYMATKSPYYDAITTLLKNRMKYVSGGQSMKVDTFNGKEILSSVRYGKDIMTADQTTGVAETSKHSGMLTLIANNQDFSLGDGTLKVNMGKLHANQAYRPLLLGTDKGIVTYENDAAAAGKIKYTDAEGNLTFSGDEIKGYRTVDMRGYLGVWVPVGAPDNQDIRVKGSDKKLDKTFSATEALDSQVIYEGFSNFQDFVEKDSQYTNKLIAENAELFKSWGITSFEMAPQFVSADDRTFLDSVIQNGYAFTDRYDLAMSKNNKYGSKEDLRDALKALHKQGIQAIADWVPDQLYQLPGQEVVTATRANSYGTPKANAYINNTLYVANSKSSGKDFQAQYGGEFLDELQKKYPQLFEDVMISTGKKIDPSVKIKQWSAKYMNGTNILGRGNRYVLSNDATGRYYQVTDNGIFLPKPLTDQGGKTGFYYDGKGMAYFDNSGFQAKNAFIKYAGNYYYFDKEGYMLTGRQDIDGKTYFFLPNGVQLRDSIYQQDGKYYYFGSFGEQYKDGYFVFDVPKEGTSETEAKFRYFSPTGEMAVGLTYAGGGLQYFDENGFQAKGTKYVTPDGKLYFFDKNSGNAYTNRWAEIDGIWYEFNDQGYAQATKGEFYTTDGSTWFYRDAAGKNVTGALTLDGHEYYFRANGAQVKGDFVTENGKISYYTVDNGYKVKDKFFEVNGKWYHADKDGNLATGRQTIDHLNYYFNADGSQVKSDFFTLDGGKTWYYAKDNGEIVTGAYSIGGKNYYFKEDGSQVKGDFVKNADGSLSYYDKDSGERINNRFLTTGNNVWYYFKDGKAVTGRQNIDGKEYYFDHLGRQVKGSPISTPKGVEYYESVLGERVTNTWITFQDGKTVFFDENGYADFDK
ncbi:MULTISPECIES: glycoside hydrolase family 70 protein [Streptococcus]|uniref:dextransucrase n=1 Tax=Streptococcus salivarius TaxID=1304 RepID=A0A074IT17_STRSL|nr:MULTISPECIES: glycoside hydrolase family 70 protein [Streptococcus]KEO43452.1 glucosyltransferase [Streptococcus salivarius]KEO46227.1 glucosyltransferase [Streptococcus salivarius]MBK5024212.1 KxYKxGKxW signal peptide domain-containing protein [Streptococcus sp. 17.1]MBK5034072.1 KxYKxGKxW signal peptide domain-containing protein [Streptococcus sp. 15.1]MBK5140547.1 KxYKxGKxW signal peptide domain-containing protein [Streptococcus sp. 16.1]